MEQATRVSTGDGNPSQQSGQILIQGEKTAIAAEESIEAASINVGGLSNLNQPHASAPAPSLGVEQMPDGVSQWSWGAFLLNGAWAIGNRTWLGAAALVPIVGFPIWFVLGVKGRAWAWRKGRWQSLEHFNKVQRRWTIWAFALYFGYALLLIGAEALSYWSS